MKLAKQITDKAGNWPDWFREQVENLPQWRRGWPEGNVIIPPDAPPHIITDTFWVPPRVGIIGHPSRGHRALDSAFLNIPKDFAGKYALWVMKSPKQDGSEQKSGNANFNQVLQNVLIRCNGRASGIAFYGAQNSRIVDVRITDPKERGLHIGYKSRNIRIEGLDIDAQFHSGMKYPVSEASGLSINSSEAQITGSINCYGVKWGVKTWQAKGVALSVCTENVETCARVDGETVVQGEGRGEGRVGGKSVKTFDLVT